MIETNSHLDISPCLQFVTCVTDHAKCVWGPGSQELLWRVWLLDGEVQLTGCLRESKALLQEWDAGSGMQTFSDNVLGAI